MGVVLLLVGCNDREKVVMYPDTNDEQVSKEIRELLEEAKAIEEANVVFLQDELFVAMQLKPFEKWKKQKYEKDWKKKLEKRFPNEKVHVSTDFKLFWESKKLMDVKNHEKVLEKIKKLKKLAKEET